MILIKHYQHLEQHEGEPFGTELVLRGARERFGPILMTALAAKRLGIQTDSVHDVQVRGTMRKIAPYAAILYDLHGQTWVYTNPSPLTFVRDRVNVDHIDGDQAILSQGPPAGTTVVTVGASELYGTEFEGGLGQ